MKFNTSKYKLSIFTEDVCEDCQVLKEKLTVNNIPFLNLSITTETQEQQLSNGNNRWEFIDAESEDTRFQWFTPVLIIEDTIGNMTYIPSVAEGTNCENGDCLETVDDLDGVLQPYLE